MGAQEQRADPGTREKDDEDEDTRSVIGLVADPGLAAELVDSVGRDLPEVLARWCGDESLLERWRIETSSQLLPLDAQGTLPLLEIGRTQRARLGWDLTVVLTELPRRAGKRPILADCQPEASVGLVSLPAMGGFRLRRRARETIAHLIAAHMWAGGDDPARYGSTPGERRRPWFRVPYELVTDREEQLADIEEGGGDADPDVQSGSAYTAVHLALTGVRGRMRLLAGMVRANRPWRLVPSLSPALAGAAAGAAFGIFYSNIWQLADAFSTSRLIVVNAVAVLANIAWLIFDNNLWERSGNHRLREESALYNAVTVMTVSFGVLCMYVLLYAVTLTAAFVAIPMNYLEATLKHPSGVADLATIAWLSATMGTIAGALGSGFAGEGAVRRAAYSAREQERQERRRAEKERADREATPADEEES